MLRFFADNYLITVDVDVRDPSAWGVIGWASQTGPSAGPGAVGPRGFISRDQAYIELVGGRVLLFCV